MVTAGYLSAAETSVRTVASDMAAVLSLEDSNAVFAVLTADHIITPQAEFARAAKQGFALVEADPSRFVTFGVTPTHPATGYGYVNRGAPIADFEGCFEADGFKEKPDLETARTYLEAGTYSWNSGMFVLSAATVLESMARFHLAVPLVPYLAY